MFIGVGNQLLAKAVVFCFLFFFQKEWSFDAVALDRISLYVCVHQPFPCVGALCTHAHLSVYVCLLMTL